MDIDDTVLVSEFVSVLWRAFIMIFLNRLKFIRLSVNLSDHNLSFWCTERFFSVA